MSYRINRMLRIPASCLIPVNPVQKKRPTKILRQDEHDLQDKETTGHAMHPRRFVEHLVHQVKCRTKSQKTKARIACPFVLTVAGESA